MPKKLVFLLLISFGLLSWSHPGCTPSRGRCPAYPPTKREIRQMHVHAISDRVVGKADTNVASLTGRLLRHGEPAFEGFVYLKRESQTVQIDCNQRGGFQAWVPSGTYAIRTYYQQQAPDSVTFKAGEIRRVEWEVFNDPKRR